MPNFRQRINEFIKSIPDTRSLKGMKDLEEAMIIGNKILEDLTTTWRNAHTNRDQIVYENLGKELVRYLDDIEYRLRELKKKNPRVIIPVTKRTGKIGYFAVYDAKTDELLSSFFHKPVTDRAGIKAEAQRIADHFKTRVKVRRL